MTGAHALPAARNFLGIESPWCDIESARVVVLSVPFERTSSYGTGSCDGPQAIIQASHQVEFFDAALGFEPYKTAPGIATLPPMAVAGAEGAAVADKLRREVEHWIKHQRFVVTLGGEHTSIVGAIHAHVACYHDVTVLQFDAHSDLRPEYQGDPWSHASAMARVLDFHNGLVQVGIRSQSLEERAIADARGLPVFYAEAIHNADRTSTDWVDDIVAACHEHVYITFDCDAFDPSVVPATGTPEPGGLTWHQVNTLIRRICAARRLIGFDVNELSPADGLSQSEYAAAKLVYRLIGLRFPAERC
ncbi:MAG TPA: agmatinase [Candidatus Hydrogenedentes bacterium]|nr:agmatinase [Candidatus Hydrogenedentota bacterium]HPG69506.1 agmatinase [Candidatus Hydrogenedentota bacterium]